MNSKLREVKRGYCKYNTDPDYLRSGEEQMLKVYGRGYRSGRESVVATIRLSSDDFYIARGVIWFLNWEEVDGESVPMISAYIQRKRVYLSDLLMGADSGGRAVKHRDGDRLNFCRNNLLNKTTKIMEM